MKIEIDSILKNYKEVLPEVEKGIEKIKNLEELKTFARLFIPRVEEILYHPLQ